MKLEHLETARLRIRQFEAADQDDCRRFRREVFEIDEPSERALNWLRWTIASYRELADLGQPPYADYAIVLKQGGAFIGSAGIVPTVVPWGALRGDPSDTLLSPEIGLFWGIRPMYRRQGFASEAGGALLNFLFDCFKARHVVATTARDNIASQRTMLRLGLRLLHNPSPEPNWRQVVGYIANPRAT